MVPSGSGTPRTPPGVQSSARGPSPRSVSASATATSTAGATVDAHGHAGPTSRPDDLAGTPAVFAAASSSSSCARPVETRTRDGDSPNSVASIAHSSARPSLAEGTSTSTPTPLVSKQHSASATARPPSAQSCAERTRPRAARSTSRAAVAARRRGPAPAPSPGSDRAAVSGTRSRPVRRALPSSTTDVPARLNVRVTTFDASSITRRHRAPASAEWPCRRFRCRG